MAEEKTLPGFPREPFPKVPDSVSFIKHRSPPAFSPETVEAPLRDEREDQVRPVAGRFLLAACLFSAVLIIPSPLEMLEIRERLFPSTAAQLFAERPRLNEFRASVNFLPPQVLEAEPDAPPAPAQTGPALSEKPDDPAIQADDPSPNLTTRTAPARSYYVQVGAFQVQRNAEQFLERIRRRFETSGMTRIDYRGTPLFIVYLDRFDHPDQALDLVRTVSREREAVVVQLTGDHYLVVQE